MSALVVQTSFIGDMILTTPLLAELARSGPVDVIATPATAPLLANHPSVRDVVVFDKRGRDRGMAGLWRFARGLRVRRDADGMIQPRGTTVAYLAQGSLRSATVATLAEVPLRVGFDTSAGRALYTRRVRYRPDRHHAERLWSLSGSEEPATAERVAPRLYPGESDRAAVDRLLLDAPGDDAPLVALAPGSIWGTKKWPYFAELAKRLVPVVQIAIIGSTADSDLAAGIRVAAGSRRVIDATGRLSLLASAELIGRATVLITNDSAPQHLASAMGTPTITIFGPTVPSFGFGPLASRSATLGMDALDCRPCHSHGPERCPLGHWRCMRDLEAARVHALVISLLPRSIPS